MKSGKLFWGIFFVAIGAFLLLDNYDVLMSGWDFVWYIWPLILILIGLALMIKKPMIKYILVGLAGFLLAAFLYGMGSNRWCCSGYNDRHPGFWDDKNATENVFEKPFEKSVQNAKFSFNSGAGTFILSNTSDKFYSIKTKSTFNGYVVDDKLSSNKRSAEVKVELEGEHSMRFGHWTNFVDVKLNPEPIWDFDLNTGACKVDFDFTPYKVKNVNIETGASKIKLRFGDLSNETFVNIECGVSKVVIEIPRSVGAEVASETGLTRINLEGFIEKDGLHRTEGYENAAKKISFKLQSGVSKFEIIRY